MLYPEFTENTDSAMLLYFASEGDEKKLGDEIEKIYVEYSRMSSVIKDGKKYIVLEIKDED